MKNRSESGLAIIAALLLASCGGGGGGGTPTPTPPTPVGNVTLSGRITFDRVPFKIVLGTGLDFARVIESPARGVIVEAIDSASSAILATANTDASGNYSMTVPGDRDLFVRAKSQMLASGSSPSWNFRVLNNTNSNALYVLDGQAFNTGGAAVTRNLRAAAGFGTPAYTTTRSAAPFAILDTVYQAKELLLTAQATLAMPPLDLFWSVSNRPSSGFCPSNGSIAGTAYQRSVGDDCPNPGVASRGIYIQGDYMNGAGDTDEFDQSVVAHEFGHYFEDLIARGDSIGGSHGSADRLDMRVAMSEGWGNAFAAMVLNDPVYRDSYSGANADFSMNVETDADPNPGWFSEATVEQVLWDAFDATNEAGDGVTVGFTPIFQTMVGAQRNTFALTDLHTFATGLKAVSPAQAAAIDLLLTGAQRGITGVGDFAVGETNNGSQPSVLPIYNTLSPNQTTAPLCTTAQFGSYNRLGNRKFLRLDLSVAATVTITAVGKADTAPPGSQAATDPDVVIWRQGVRVKVGDSEVPGQESLDPLPLQSGTYIIEVYDYPYANPGTSTSSSTPHCMTVAAAG